MCGIAGIALSPSASLPDLRERLGAMLGAQTHRGPDDAGLFLSPDCRVGLANRRLAIRWCSCRSKERSLNLSGTMQAAIVEFPIVSAW
jgi:asparagine synthase (glutamine-hydrolysing)